MAIAIKGKTLVRYVALVDRADSTALVDNPTIAPGDVLVSTDGSAFTNIATLPSIDPAGSAAVKVELSATEMNGENIQVLFRDAAGDEWADLMLSINTVPDANYGCRFGNC